jgi:plasmid maintenance system antidote protein VapI
MRSLRNPNRKPTHPGAVLREDVLPELAWTRKLTQMVNKLKIETSISLRMRDEEVEIHGKSNCWDIGRR